MINRASPRRSLVFILELLLNMLGHWFRAFFYNPWVPAPRGDSTASESRCLRAAAQKSGSRGCARAVAIEFAHFSGGKWSARSQCAIAIEFAHFSGENCSATPGCQRTRSASTLRADGGRGARRARARLQSLYAACKKRRFRAPRGCPARGKTRPPRLLRPLWGAGAPASAARPKTKCTAETNATLTGKRLPLQVRECAILIDAYL